MPRPSVHVFIAASLDGFIAREDGGIDWLDRVARDGEDYGYGAFSASVDTLVIGRGTWDTVAGFPDWPYAGRRVIVLSHRPLTPRADEERRSGDLAALLDRLGDEGARSVYLDGGQVIRQAIAAGLVDTLTVSVIPVTLGAGRPLFGPSPERAWRLLEARSWNSGLAQLRYARA
ncbi:MAG TPA: dihydrofolate reductase family protein [Myxococcota bacterium]|nr:dihydrofolate reductase family protein [Myxococcota bacterium]